MKRLRCLTALMLTLLAARAAAQESAAGDPAVFAAALERCEPAVLKIPHPLVRPFIITHTIAGEKDDRCAYTQTMPGGMTMICAFTEAGRKSMGDEIRALSEDAMLKGSTRGPQPAWTRECEIETADGKRMPFGR